MQMHMQNQIHVHVVQSYLHVHSGPIKRNDDQSAAAPVGAAIDCVWQTNATDCQSCQLGAQEAPGALISIYVICACIANWQSRQTDRLPDGQTVGQPTSASLIFNLCERLLNKCASSSSPAPSSHLTEAMYLYIENVPCLAW